MNEKEKESRHAEVKRVTLASEPGARGRGASTAQGSRESDGEEGGINFIKRYPRAIAEGPGRGEGTQRQSPFVPGVINAAFIREMLPSYCPEPSLPALSSGYTLARPYLATLTRHHAGSLVRHDPVPRCFPTSPRTRARARAHVRGIRKNDLRSSPISYLVPFPFHFTPATTWSSSRGNTCIISGLPECTALASRKIPI